MNLLEYQAKDLLKNAGIAVPKSHLMQPGDTFKAGDVPFPLVLKSQVPVGGRGKAGGIKIVSTEAGANAGAAILFSHEIKGHKPQAVLAEAAIETDREFYFSITIDRASQSIALIAHPDGGIDIESANPEKLLNITELNNIESAAKKVLSAYGLAQGQLTIVREVVENIYQAFIQNDALLIEINPLVLTNQNALIAADAKIILDNTAGFRHKNWKNYTAPESANFVVLNEQGEVAAMANGAGLAMATVDAIAASKLKPANFLDVGGGSSTESMLAAFKRITELPNVKAIIINIFAGITRCDEVAQAIVEAKKQADVPPLFIRLYGTNQAKGEAILQAAGIKTLGSLEECVREARHAIA